MKLEKLKREIKVVKNKIDCMWIIVAFLGVGLAVDIAVAVLNSTSIFNIICFIIIGVGLIIAIYISVRRAIEFKKNLELLYRLEEEYSDWIQS